VKHQSAAAAAPGDGAGSVPVSPAGKRAGEKRSVGGVSRWAALTAAGLMTIAGMVIGTGAGTAHAATTPGKFFTSDYALGGWSGYVAEGGSYNQVSAWFVVPGADCVTDGSTLYWVGIQGDDGGTTAIAQTGFQVDCSDGNASYDGWIANLQGVFSGFGNPVYPGDSIYASVTCSGSLCGLYLDDATQGWSQYESYGVVDGFSGIYAAVAGENNDSDGYAFSGPTAVTDANINYAPLSQSDPVANEQNPSNYNGPPLIETPLDPSGEDFDFYWD
jgi:hypothetical protein